jgi:sodium-dependent dicarboxylate transporter 2/3/5
MINPDHHKPPARQRVGLILGPALFLLVIFNTAPSGMSDVAWRAAAVGALMATWWITEAVPIPATALLPLVLFPLLGVLKIDSAAAPYANPVIFLFMGGFLLAIAMERVRLHLRLALSIIRIGGTRPPQLVAGFMVATAFLSMWVSNTATVAMMLPLTAAVLVLADGDQNVNAEKRGNLATALLLGVAYASSIGGVGTLIGTPPNALLAGFLSESYGIRIGFVQWMAIGVPLVVVALPITWLLLVRVIYPVSTEPIVGGRAAVHEQLRALGPVARAEWLVGVVVTMTAAAWVFSPLLVRWVPGISDAGIAIAGALLLFLLPIGGGHRALDWQAAERLPWGVLVLFGGGLSLARAAEQSGLTQWIGGALSPVGSWPVVLVVIAVTAVIVFLTEMTSNTATAAAFLPVVAALAIAIGANPALLAVPAAISASCAFMLPVATPPNAIVYASGRLTIPQMARAGLWLNLILIVLVTLLAITIVPLMIR